MDERKQQTYTFPNNDADETDISATERAFDVVRLLSILLQGLGLTSTINGILYLYYTGPDTEWPMASGSGVWTGILTFIAGLVGYVGHRTPMLAGSGYDKNKTLAFYCLVIIVIAVSVLQTVYSTYGFIACVTKSAVPCSYTGKVIQIMTTEALSVSFGLLILILSVSGTIFMTYNRTLQVQLENPKMYKYRHVPTN